MLKGTTSIVALVAACFVCGAAAAQDEQQQQPDTSKPTAPAPQLASGLSLNPVPGAVSSANAPLDDPYPIEGAGWSRPLGRGYILSRWAEDWRKDKAAGKAPPLKAMPLFGRDDIYLTLSGEIRLRSHFYDDGRLVKGNDYHEFQFRAVAGADLHLGTHFRIYGELGHGTIEEEAKTAVNPESAAEKNKISVQQLFGEARDTIGGALVGAMVGRMEYVDGPKQLISVSEGPNLHRTWNGFRLYMHTDRFRIGYFQGKPTLQNFGGFDEKIDHTARINSVMASVLAVRGGDAGNVFFDPLYIHSYNERGTSGPSTGLDRRDTYGARLWGRYGVLNFDWMAYKQSGDHIGQTVDAWMASFNQNITIIPKWKLRIGARIDLASGNHNYTTTNTGTVYGFNPIYQTRNYYGESEFLGYSNLFDITPTLNFNPVKNVAVLFEYDIASRMNQHDAFYAAGTIAYAGTQNVRGHFAGGLARLAADWDVTRNVQFQVELDRMSAGKVLSRAGFGNGNYAMLGLNLRY